MRTIQLSDSDGRLLDDAAFQLVVHAFFPEHEEDRRMAMDMIQQERQRLDEVGPEAYRLSSLTRAGLRLVEKQTGTMTLCGLVAIVMVGRGLLGQSMALKPAAEVVSELVYATGKVEWVSFSTGQPESRSMSITGDLSNIEKAFRKYRSVAHICAARVVSSEYLAPLPIYARAPEAEACFIATAAWFQAHLSRVPNFLDWNSWDVLRTLPQEILDYPPLLPSEETLRNIWAPWELMQARNRGGLVELTPRVEG